MTQVLRWCRQCGQRKPLSGFDTVNDKKRRFCSVECANENKAHGYAGKKKSSIWN